MGIFKQKKHEQIDWKRIEGLIYQDRTIMSTEEWDNIRLAKDVVITAHGFDTRHWHGREAYVNCEMCQGLTPKGKPCEYCGRAT